MSLSTECAAALLSFRYPSIIVSFGVEKEFTLHCVYLPVLENSKQFRTIEAYIPPHPCRWSCRGLEGLLCETASVHVDSQNKQGALGQSEC